MADGAYVYEFADGIYVKPQATEEMAVSSGIYGRAPMLSLQILINTKIRRYLFSIQTGVGHASETTYLVQDAVTTDGVVALDFHCKRDRKMKPIQ